jgi:DNA-binding NtrC family response regulator
MGWSVLCVSKISPAQVTRNMILERAGYKVVAIVNPDEAMRIFASSPADAVVLGDSIPADRRLDLARSFKRQHQHVPIIAFSNSSGSQLPAGTVDEQLESLGDPHLLLEALKRVLARDGDGSANSAAPDVEQAGRSTSAHDGSGAATPSTVSKTPKNSAV